MSYLKKIRLFFYQYFLKRQLNKRAAPPRGITYESAQTIGILFDADDVDQRERVQSFAKHLKKKGKKVSLLGYFDHPVDSPNFTFPYFTSKDLNWALCPRSKEATTFMDENFDIWITADTESRLHTEYLATLSRARLRVGPVTEHTECYELMIDMGSHKDLTQFLKQVEVLLEKTNPKHEPV